MLILQSCCSRFIAERARIILEGLSDFGPKVTGSYVNEVLAIHFLTVQINHTMHQANPVHKISYDLQKPSGAFVIPYKTFEQTYVYSGIQNIVVKIGPHNPVNGSLLVNCHFDTVPISPGTLFIYCIYILFTAHHSKNQRICKPNHGGMW